MTTTPTTPLTTPARGLVGTKELYDLLTQFEREAKKLFYGHKVERTDRADHIHGQFFHDGEVNRMFVVFMTGYQFGKFVARQDDAV